VIGSEGEHYLRLSIATGDDDLKEAVARIETAAADTSGFGEFVASRRRLTL
jgi:aspartate/methionine/tyrosine aminotransferase